MEADLNLLIALDALLAEESVTGAARRLGLSPSAMSRTLSRLRAATGDPLLVRAGRSLVPTPRAVELRGRVPDLARQAKEVLRPPAGAIDLATLDRSFVIRASESFMLVFAAAVTQAVVAGAPKATFRFVHKPNKDATQLREGAVDLEIGVIGTSAPEMRARLILRDRFIGVVREGHGLLDGTMSARRYAACSHVVVSRRESGRGPVDEALAALGLERRIAVVVPGHPDALRMASHSELVALVPASCLAIARAVRDGAADRLVGFELPVATPGIAVSATWHPRMDADPAHRWLRDTVTNVCRSMFSAATVNAWPVPKDG